MSAETVQAIPLDTFREDQRVRKQLNDELVEQIAQSFQLVGQLQPVRARWVGTELLLVDGHHRLAAAYKAGLKTLGCIVEQQALEDGQVIQRQLILNCLRESLSSVETARAIGQLMQATGWNASQAANNLGFSNAKVTRLLALLALPPAILQEVEAGRIPASAGYELAQVENPEQQAELAQHLATGMLTRDAVAGRRKARVKAAAGSTEAAPARVTALLGAGRTITVSAAGLTLESFISLIEELLGKARRVRAQGVELGTFIKMLRDQARAG